MVSLDQNELIGVIGLVIQDIHHNIIVTMCLELRPQCTLECHWRKIVVSQCVSSVLPVVFQWSFSVCSIIQINTESPLGHHWVLTSASVVPVAFQCNCGSNGFPVWSVQWYPSVLTESGLEVIRSGHFPACDPYVYNWYGESCLS